MAKVSCPVCGVGLKISEGQVGKPLRCPACGAGFRPRASAAAAPSAPAGRTEKPAESSPPSRSSTGTIAMVDEPAPGKEQCPSCGQTCPPGAVLCVNCGYDFRTGGKLATEGIASGPGPGAAARAGKGPGKPRTQPPAEGGIGLAALLSLLAVGGPLLSLMGLRFGVSVFSGDAAALIGIPFAAVAFFLWTKRNKRTYGIATVAAGVLALLLTLLISPGNSGPAVARQENVKPPRLKPEQMTRDQLKAEIEAGKARILSIEGRLKQIAEQIPNQQGKVGAAKQVLDLAKIAPLASGSGYGDAVRNLKSQEEEAQRLEEEERKLLSEYQTEPKWVNDLIIAYNVGGLSSRASASAPASPGPTLAEARRGHKTVLSPSFGADEPVAAPPAGLFSGVSYGAARRVHKTVLSPSFGEGEPVAAPPAGVLRIVSYPSADGNLAAYVSPPPGDGKKHPAIIWLIGGFSNGIGDVAWREADSNNDQSASAFRKAGIVMMYPSLRGGNENRGVREGFYGEVDDVLAAAKFLAAQDYVDPQRIYLGGHSTGGTLALLAAECSNYFRAVFSFGPIVDVGSYGLENCPFNPFDDTERALRSPGMWLGSISSPTFVLEGDQAPGNLADLQAMKEACRNSRVSFRQAPGKNHYSILAPVTALIAKKINGDSAATCRIAIKDKDLADLGRN